MNKMLNISQPNFHKAQVLYLAEKYIGNAQMKNNGFIINNVKTGGQLSVQFNPDDTFSINLFESKEVDDGDDGSVKAITDIQLADNVDVTEACKLVTEFQF